jgi:hypothetical protein
MVLEYTSLINKLINNSTKGGAKSDNVFVKFLIMFISIMIIFLLKGLIIYISYNYIMPKLIYSLSQDPAKTEEKIRANFRLLTFSESVVLVILMLTLVR